MNLTDFYFLCAFAVILVVYYAIPRRFQWVVIFVSSIAYYLAQGHPVLILYPVCSVLISYLAARYIAHCNETEDTASSQDRVRRHKKAAFICSVVLLLAVLILLKYLKLSGLSGLLVPLGLSYYTFSLIGYIADVYNGITRPESDPLKLLAFGMYFPAIVSGPIMQYRNVSGSFFEEHSPNLQGITDGLKRMLWGFFKKLVIAQRLNPIVEVLFSDPVTFDGANVFWAVFLFTVQLYTDFSGLMDIVLGISQCLGISLPENFNTPFFSKTISEYWRRWHITLGVWFKEYVFYPILRTSLYVRLQDGLKKRFGKKRGKHLATYIAMFVLWLTVGLWHGGKFTFVIGSGLLHWFYIVMEESLQEPFVRLWKRIGVDPGSKVLDALRIVRTFILVNLGNLFFRSSSVRDALFMLRRAFTGDRAHLWSMIGDMRAGLSERGVRALSDGTMLNVTFIGAGILIVSILILLTADVYKAKTGRDLRAFLDARPAPVRFILWFAFLFFVILLAEYGPGYSSAEFIYQGF